MFWIKREKCLENRHEQKSDLGSFRKAEHRESSLEGCLEQNLGHQLGPLISLLLICFHRSQIPLPQNPSQLKAGSQQSQPSREGDEPELICSK